MKKVFVLSGMDEPVAVLETEEDAQSYQDSDEMYIQEVPFVPAGTPRVIVFKVAGTDPGAEPRRHELPVWEGPFDEAKVTFSVYGDSRYIEVEGTDLRKVHAAYLRGHARMKDHDVVVSATPGASGNQASCAGCGWKISYEQKIPESWAIADHSRYVRSKHE